MSPYKITRFSTSCFVIILLQLVEHEARIRGPDSQYTVIIIVHDGVAGASCRS